MDAPGRASVFEKVVVEPAYKAVSAAIERAIVDGDLPPGAALPTEQALSERFGVHRSTVRQAIRQVEQEGLLTLEPLAARLAASHATDGDLTRLQGNVAEWTRRHMVDFQRGFALAGLDMSTPIAQPA